MAIRWSDEYNINIKMIDEQHQHLVALLSRMYDIIAVGDNADEDNAEKSQIRRVFAELVDYTDYHFKNEEELLKMYNYPTLKNHKQQHHELSMQLLKLQMNFAKGQTISIALLDFLNNWLINHICGSDKKYASFIHSKQQIL